MQGNRKQSFPITGEKGSVKILYSESLDGSYLQNNYNGSDAESNSSPEAAAVAAATAAAMAAAASCQQNKFQGNFLPLDNLNLAMGGLTLNTNSPPAAAAVAAANVASQAPPPTVAPPSKPQQQQQQQHSPQLPMNGGTSGAGSTGFAPFQPPRPPHQPITYTAGTFAQTKFGSTKLKSNAKKTNRMSPTEFSNYIKQRAMQKQGGTGPQQPPVPVQPQPQQPSVSANTNPSSALMPIGKQIFDSRPPLALHAIPPNEFLGPPLLCFALHSCRFVVALEVQWHGKV